MADHGLHGPGLGKEVASARNDFQRLCASQSRKRLFVELDDAEIYAADDQKRGRVNGLKRSAREVRTPAARDHGSDTMRKPGRRHERRRSRGAGAEQSERKPFERGLPFQPAHCIDKPIRQ